MENILVLHELAKSFGQTFVVQDLSFAVPRGQCVGLLGPNGAGKTTTISIISGLLRSTRGQVLLYGSKIKGDSDPLKFKIGLVPQDLALYEELSAMDNLKFFGSLYGLERSILQRRISESLAFVGLQDRASDKVQKFSGGMKRRLNLAVALLHDPELLMLDEPTVGVDPQSRNSIFENIRTLTARGKTIIYTTHYMEEVERLCERVLIMDHGRLVADDSIANLKKAACRGQFLLVETRNQVSAQAVDEINKLSGVRAASAIESLLRVEMDDLENVTGTLLHYLQIHKIPVNSLKSEQPNLESVFLQLTGRQLRDS